VSLTKFDGIFFVCNKGQVILMIVVLQNHVYDSMVHVVLLIEIF